MIRPDTVTRVVLETIQSCGYAVKVADREVSATDSKTGERFIVRFDEDKNELYAAVVELVQRVGIDLSIVGRKPNARRRSQIARWRAKGVKVADIAQRLRLTRQAGGLLYHRSHGGLKPHLTKGIHDDTETGKPACLPFDHCLCSLLPGDL
ncbi:MAG: hypothetical protein IID37_04810 [Planctomycetes bacterium]|nr:hypothetical protein [Planctomycetota bacterium]